MLSLMPFTPRYAIFYAIYPKICYHLCHIPRSSAIFFLNVMLQYITLTPSYANSSYAMFSGQSRGRISGYCCIGISLWENFTGKTLFLLQGMGLQCGNQKLSFRNEFINASSTNYFVWFFFWFELCLFTVLSKMMRLEIFNERLARHWVRVDKVEYVIGNSILQVFPLILLYPWHMKHCLAVLLFLLIGREKIWSDVHHWFD
jgi:hypothetical protein